MNYYRAIRSVKDEEIESLVIYYLYNIVYEEFEGKIILKGLQVHPIEEGIISEGLFKDPEHVTLTKNIIASEILYTDGLIDIDGNKLF